MRVGVVMVLGLNTMSDINIKLISILYEKNFTGITNFKSLNVLC